MRLAGVEIVSRATRSSMRILLSIGVAVLLVHYLEIEISHITFFGVDLKLDQTTSIIHVVLLISLISHIIQWFGDYLSLRNWNIGMKSTEVEIFYGGRTGLVPKLKLYISELENLKANFADEKFELVEKQLGELTIETERLTRSIVSGKSFSLFYLIGWHLLLPVFVGFWALYIF